VSKADEQGVFGALILGWVVGRFPHHNSCGLGRELTRTENDRYCTNYKLSNPTILSTFEISPLTDSTGMKLEGAALLESFMPFPAKS